MIAAAFLCLVASVTDGDTFRCADGTRVRVAGVNAAEIHGDPCPEGRPCPAMPAQRSRTVLDQMAGGQRLRCVQVGTSYRRAVATCTLPNGSDLSCSLLAAGAAARWDRYWRRYGMRECR